MNSHGRNKYACVFCEIHVALSLGKSEMPTPRTGVIVYFFFFHSARRDAHKCAASSARDEKKKNNARAMAKNTKRRCGRGHVSPYRFAINPRINSSAGGRKVLTNEFEISPEGSLEAEHVERFLLRSINSPRNFPTPAFVDWVSIVKFYPWPLLFEIKRARATRDLIPSRVTRVIIGRTNTNSRERPYYTYRITYLCATLETKFGGLKKFRHPPSLLPRTPSRMYLNRSTKEEDDRESFARLSMIRARVVPSRRKRNEINFASR